MEQVAQLLVGSAGIALVVVGLVGIVAVIFGRPRRPAVAALEMLFWFAVIVALGGLLLVVSLRLR